MTKLKLSVTKKELQNFLSEKKDFFISWRDITERWELRVATKQMKKDVRCFFTKMICCHVEKEKVLERAREILPRNVSITEYDYGFREHYDLNLWEEQTVNS